MCSTFRFCFAVLIVLCPLFNVQAQSPQTIEWGQSSVDVRPSPAVFEPGIAHDTSGRIGVATAFHDGPNTVLKYYYQTLESYQLIWNEMVVWSVPGNLFINTSDVAYDALGGVGVTLSVSGASIGPAGADIAILYFYKANGATSFSGPEIVYFDNKRASPLRAIVQRLDFDIGNNPIVAFIYKRIYIEDNEEEWSRASLRIASKTGGTWQTNPVGNQDPFGTMFAGYPVSCRGLTDLDMFIDTSTTSYPIHLAFTELKVRSAPGVSCPDRNDVIHLRTNSAGVVMPGTFQSMTTSLTNGTFRYVALAVLGSEVHVAFDRPSNQIYRSKKGTGGWTTPALIGNGSIGGMSATFDQVHLSIKGSSTVFVVSGPDWPTSSSSWVQANGDRTMASDTWRPRISSRILAGTVEGDSESVGVTFESVASTGNPAATVVASGCTDPGDAKSLRFGSASGDFAVMLITLALFVGFGVRTKRSIEGD